MVYTAVCVGESTVCKVWLLSSFTCFPTTLVCAVSCVMVHCAGLFMLWSIVCYVVWLLAVRDIPCHSIQCVLVLCSKGQTMYLVVTCTTSHLLLCIFCPPACMCTQVLICFDPVANVQCRMDSMPLILVLSAAILPLLSTFPSRWRATSLTLMMMDTQLCTGQPKRASCPWWSTLWDPVDLMWRPLTRLARMYVYSKLHAYACNSNASKDCLGLCPFISMMFKYLYLNKMEVSLWIAP